MRIAVASGKGGTGKTTLALALAASYTGEVNLLDCDVEEPNCHLFLRVEADSKIPVFSLIPALDKSKCIACGTCSKICAYNAIAFLGKPMIFEELCHSCGGCVRICPSGALKEVQKEIGSLEFRKTGSINLVTGLLNVGHAMSPPLIRVVKKHISENTDTIIDCPPGTSCPMVTAVKGADYVIMVTEPTPFGLHDLKLAVESVRQLGLRFGVVINRSDSGNDDVKNFCRTNRIPLLLEIPDRREIAEAYSRGIPLADAMPEIKPMMQKLRSDITQACNR